MRAETLANGADDVIEVRAHAVHLVDEADARNAVLVGLAPNGFRIAAARRQRSQTTQTGCRQERARSVRLHGETTWPGVSMMLTRYFCRRVQLAVVAALVMVIPRFALLLHPVHGGRAFIHRTDFVGDTGVEQDALGRRGLSGVDVRHNPDIAGVFKFEYAAHSPLNGPFLSGSCCDSFTHGNHQIFLKVELPAIVGESLVGFGHAVHVFLLLDGAAAGIRRVDQFIGELFHHGLAGALARILQ